MSKLNCWPGCLARNVGGAFPRNLGAFVEVVDFYRCEPGEWRVRTLSPVDSTLGPIGAGMLVWAYDKDLRPITPPPGTVSETEVKELYEPSKKSTPQTAEIASSDRVMENRWASPALRPGRVG